VRSARLLPMHSYPRRSMAGVGVNRVPRTAHPFYQIVAFTESGLTIASPVLHPKAC